ncbi:GPI ethanolamine phosphate transferase 2 [Aplysia californica]|uniref:GPI ethanolamine phosphate transferase 2 n=1 Tax=Aplysia californica TaxID=6500 RepID=A0ABM1A6L1_APLCA|nr:GPI ethanolamine phosphate transferase 2 [Aplysia californica]
MMCILLLLRTLAVVFALSVFFRGFFPLKQVPRDISRQKISVSLPLPPESVTKTTLLNDDSGPGNHDATSTVSQKSLQNGIVRQREIHIKENGKPHLASRYPEHLNTDSSVSFQRLIFLVIDAFRSDFFFGPYQYMPKVNRIFELGHGIKFVAESHPPTVTMPRIKAITTGNIPSFIDVVLNFGSVALEEDNIVSQLKAAGKNIVFFGDDTWLKLFPDHFLRSDGTTSFFVTDYTEVDRNVTRHLPSELIKNDWDVMILHYLGLDHIGHTAGPSSNLVRPKLGEMDDVIEQIYKSMEKWAEPSLLVVCGDHGMTDQGGHGGATPQEVFVPVLFLSPSIKSPVGSKPPGLISQADLCPTLSVLMDVPVPLNSLGKIVTDALVGFSLQQKLSIVHQNAQQAMKILENYVANREKESSYMMYQRASEEMASWFLHQNSSPHAQWEEQGLRLLDVYAQSLSLMAERVDKLSTQYDVYAMAAAMVLLWMLFASLILSHINVKVTESGLRSWSSCFTVAFPVCGSVTLSHITMCTGGVPSPLICQATGLSVAIQLSMLAVFLSLSVHFITHKTKLWGILRHIQIWLWQSSVVEKFLIVGSLGHALSLMSSSFVEEEHQTLYFLTTTVHVLLLLQLPYQLWNRVRVTKEEPMSKGGNTSVPDDSKRYINLQPDEGCYGSDQEQRDGECDGEDTRLYQELNRAEIEQRENCVRDGSGNLQEKDSKKTDNASSVTSGGSRAALSFKSAVHLSFSLVCVLVFLRVMRRWNQTGNKWQHLPDFSDWLVMSEHKPYLSLMVAFSMMVISCSRQPGLAKVQVLFMNLSLAGAFFSRVASGSLFFPSRKFLSDKGVLEARISLCCSAMVFLLSILPENFTRLEVDCPKEQESQNLSVSQRKRSARLNFYESSLSRSESPSSEYAKCQSTAKNVSCEENSNSKKLFRQTSVSQENGKAREGEGKQSHRVDQQLSGIVSSWLCAMCMLLRPHNIPLVAMSGLIEQMVVPALTQLHVRPTYALIYCLWMGRALFFFQGNSNSVSTVDVSAGYIVISDYAPGVIGVFMCIATFAGPILWFFALLRITHRASVERPESLKSTLRSLGNTLLWSQVLLLTLYTGLVSAQRYHLFVWTVFSPKMLYLGMDTVVVSVFAVLLYLASSFW